MLFSKTGLLVLFFTNLSIIVFFQPNCPISDENDPIGDREVFKHIGGKMRCKFNFLSVASKKKELPNVDVVHEPPKLSDLVPRAPVVAIVGHIDHGKTTLLDRLRNSNVVETEFGGITQHIGAFSVSLSKYAKSSDTEAVVDRVTFLDTPGHAAFKNMRVRGALVTDIVILVVDASEGPLEQTIESIDAVRKARVSMIVALNKIDKPNANIEMTKKALFKAGVQLEDFGGDIQAVPISALKGNGIEDLIDAIIAQAEVLQLSADPKGPVEGSVIESSVEIGLGKTATFLVKRGTLKRGKILVCGETYARVKQVMDTRAPIGEAALSERNEVKTAKPAEACRITGWKDLPHAGGHAMEVESEKKAMEIVRWRIEKRKIEETERTAQEIEAKRLVEREIYEKFKAQKIGRRPVFAPNSEANRLIIEQEERRFSNRKIHILVKSDVDGSHEAILNCLSSYDEPEVELDILHSGVGEISETELKLAQDFQGVVYAYNIRIPDETRKLASFMNVPIKEHNVIYSLIDDLKEEVSLKLPEVDEERVVGSGVVVKEFLINEKRSEIPVAGCKVHHGIFHKLKLFKVTRKGETIFKGSLTSLKYHKDEQMEISQGQECGLRLTDSGIRFQSGDVITCYEMEKTKRSTQWTPGF